MTTQRGIESQSRASVDTVLANLIDSGPVTPDHGLPALAPRGTFRRVSRHFWRRVLNAVPASARRTSR